MFDADEADPWLLDVELPLCAVAILLSVSMIDLWVDLWKFLFPFIVDEYYKRKITR